MPDREEIRRARHHQDCVTVAKAIELQDPLCEIWASQMWRESRQNLRWAGDGTTTATLVGSGDSARACAPWRPEASPMALKRHR